MVGAIEEVKDFLIILEWLRKLIKDFLISQLYDTYTNVEV